MTIADTLAPADELRARLNCGLPDWRTKTDQLDAAFLAAAPATYATWQTRMAAVVTGARQRVVASGIYADALDPWHLIGSTWISDCEVLQRQRRAVLGA